MITRTTAPSAADSAISQEKWLTRQLAMGHKSLPSNTVSTLLLWAICSTAPGVIAQSLEVPLAEAPLRETPVVEGGPSYESDFIDDGLFEDPPEEDRYRVEVIIFEQQDIYGAEGKSLVREVTFPGQLKLLQPTQTLNRPLSATSDRAEQLASLMIPEKFHSYESAKRRDTYVLLDKSERLLNPDAYTLNRSSTYRVLFHQGWEQRLDSKNATPWVFVDGGMTFGEHRELEGSLRIYQSRFTHVEVKLWLADFETQLPKVPEVNEQQGAVPESETEQITLPEPPQQPEPEYLALIRSLLPSADPLDAGNDRENSDQPDVGKSVDNPYLRASTDSWQTTDTGYAGPDQQNGFQQNEPAKPEYRVAAIDLLQSSEQIRRKNLHYIDHPRIGVLVLVTPVVSTENSE